jgi:riboflavin-specific deaminase-like protein
MRNHGPEDPLLLDLPTLARLRDAAASGEAVAVAQLGQSLDGRIATITGHSHYVNGPSAIRLLHVLRANVDAVIVGAGTARADDPQLTVRHCPGPSPARVLIDRRRSAGARLRMLANDGSRRIVFGPVLPDDPPGIETLSAAGDAPLEPATVLAALAERGLARVLVEGGAATVSAFLAAGALERLCVLVAPLLIGSGPVGLNLPQIATLEEARRPAVTTAALPEGDVVFDCALR